MPGLHFHDLRHRLTPGTVTPWPSSPISDLRAAPSRRPALPPG